MKHKRSVRALVALTLVAALLAAVGCDGTSTASSEAASSQKAASTASAGANATESKAPLPETDERGYILIANCVQNQDLAISVADTSALFAKDAPGYVVEGGPYFVDAETLKRLTTAKVEGTGSVKWIDHKTIHTVSEQTDLFDGVIPVSKLSDPIFLCMNEPSDIRTYYPERINGENMYAAEARHTNILSIGAIYRNEDNPPPDDMEITLCFQNIRLLLHTAEKGWFLADEHLVPTNGMVNNVYYLPWGHKPASYTLPSRNITRTEDHTEVKMTGADFNGKNANDEQTKAAVLHFWGQIKKFEDLGIKGEDIDGILVSFYVWVKEPEAAGHLAATIGADLRPGGKTSTDQAFSGHNYVLGTTPRNVIGHNVGPAAYDKIMDTELVQKLIGLK